MGCIYNPDGGNKKCIQKFGAATLRTKIRVIKSRRMGCVGHSACIGEMRNIYSILVGNPVGKG
jgi:hypothetical protein